MLIKFKYIIVFLFVQSACHVIFLSCHLNKDLGAVPMKEDIVCETAAFPRTLKHSCCKYADALFNVLLYTLLWIFAKFCHHLSHFTKVTGQRWMLCVTWCFGSYLNMHRFSVCWTFPLVLMKVRTKSKKEMCTRALYQNNFFKAKVYLKLFIYLTFYILKHNLLLNLFLFVIQTLCTVQYSKDSPSSLCQANYLFIRLRLNHTMTVVCSSRTLAVLWVLPLLLCHK